MLDWLPENVSSYGAEMDSLLALILCIVGVWFVIVEVVLIAMFVFLLRRRPEALARLRAAWNE